KSCPPPRWTERHQAPLLDLNVIRTLSCVSDPQRLYNQIYRPIYRTASNGSGNLHAFPHAPGGVISIKNRKVKNGRVMFTFTERNLTKNRSYGLTSSTPLGVKSSKGGNPESVAEQ
ncbi:hypothetical protein AVEN_45555-1, partial [Araneus ventricosus]